MRFTKEYIEAVSKGEHTEEIKKLHPLQAMQLGLAVRQYEEEQGVKKGTVEFDNEAIGQALREQNKNVRNY